MKLSQLTKPLLATAIALSVGTLQILPASAQAGAGTTGTGTTGTGTTGTGTAGTGTTVPDTTVPDTTVPDTTAPTTTTDPAMTSTTPVERNDGFNWGWLGLLGLIGLAGLRKSEEREVYRDPSVDPARTATRTSDYNR